MSRTGPLWSAISQSGRAEVIPFLSTVAFVAAGDVTAEAIVRLTRLTPYGVELPDGPAVADVAGMLLLLNLAVVLWFAYRTGKEALEGGGPVPTDAKLIGLVAAVATCGDLVAYAMKSHYPDRCVYALPVVLYVFVVPFFLFDRTRSGSASDDRAIARYALGATTLVAAAVLPAIAAIIAGSLYETAFNDIGYPHPIVAGVLKQVGRTEFWGVSAGIVGIAWIPVLLCACRWTDPYDAGTTVRLCWQSALLLAAASVGIFAVMAEVLVKDDTLLLQSRPASVTFATMLVAKALLATAIAALFTCAFYVARAVHRSGLPALAAHAASLVAFLVAGAAVGGLIVAIRIHLAGAAPSPWALAALHAGATGVVYACGRITMWFVRKALGTVTPAFG